MAVSCPQCGLPPDLMLRARLLGARMVYVESKRCPQCGYKSEAAKKHEALRFVLWDKLCADDEGVSPEKRREEWRRREARREGLQRLLGDDERFLPLVEDDP